MVEQQSGAEGLPQLQFLFLELPKLQKHELPLEGPALWAWLFRHAPTLDKIPEELPEDFKSESLAKCEGEEIMNAKAFMVRTEIGGKASLIPGTQASLLIPDGPIYTYAIGATPEANAKAYFDIRMGRINEVLANMVKLNEAAMTGIGNYTSDPPVNGE